MLEKNKSLLFFGILVFSIGVIPFSFAQQSSDTDDDDNDGLTNYDEQNIYFTEYLKFDTDDDGLSDGQEVLTHLTDPKNSDTDGDGLSDGQEVLMYPTSPLISDTDGDGLSDGQEVLTYFTDPLVFDTDGDGISDGDEVLIFKTNPKISVDFFAAPLIGSLVDNDDVFPKIDGYDILVTFTEPANTSKILEYEIYLLAENIDLDMTTHIPIMKSIPISPSLLHSVRGDDGLTVDSTGNLLKGCPVNYAAFVVSVFDRTTSVAGPTAPSCLIDDGDEISLDVFIDEALIEKNDIDATVTEPSTTYSVAPPTPNTMNQVMPNTMNQVMPNTMNQVMPNTMNQVMPNTMNQVMPMPNIAARTITIPEMEAKIISEPPLVLSESISITTVSDEYLFGDDIQYKGTVDNSILTHDIEVSIKSSDGKTMTSNFQNVQLDGTFSGNISTDINWEESGLYEIRARVGNSFSTSSFEFEGSTSDIEFAFGGITTDTDYVTSDELSKYTVNVGGPKDAGFNLHVYSPGVLQTQVLSNNVCGDYVCTGTQLTTQEKIQAYLLEKFETDSISKAKKLFGQFGAMIPNQKLDLENLPTHSSVSLPDRKSVHFEAIKDALISGIDISTLKTDDLSPIQKSEKLKELSSELVTEMYKADASSDAGDLKKTVEHLKKMKKIFKEIKSLK